METARAQNDPVARWLGLLVFLLGIGFLVLVFAIAYADLPGSGVLGELTGPSAPTPAPATPGAGGSVVWWTLAVKGVLLFLMAYVGAAVANRGIGMYAAARAPHDA